jgi:hypothetical protein
MIPEQQYVGTLVATLNGEKLNTGWPAIIFSHGRTAPDVYRIIESYVAYVDSPARSGDSVPRSDYRC